MVSLDPRSAGGRHRPGAARGEMDGLGRPRSKDAIEWGIEDLDDGSARRSTASRFPVRGPGWAYMVGGLIAAWIGGSALGVLPNPGSSAVDAAPAGQVAPDLTFETLEGKRVQLATLRGQPVAFFFMASWCLTCAPEAQAWSQLAAERQASGLRVFVVDIDPGTSRAALEDFRDAYAPAGLEWVIDSEQVLLRAFEVAALDTTVVLDEDGRVAYTDGYATPKGQLDEVLARLGTGG